jgi:hypothetical protein
VLGSGLGFVHWGIRRAGAGVVWGVRVSLW